MENSFESVENLLNKTWDVDSFYECRDLVWVDWREFDEDIVEYFNSRIDDKIEVISIRNGKSYEDILLKDGNRSLQIPYGENMDRDTTITYLNDFLKPKYEIRWFMESLGSDTLGFIIMKSEDWNRLEEKYASEILNFYFEKIEIGKAIFEMSMEKISQLMKIRDENKFYF